MKLISSIVIIVSKKTLLGIPINNGDTVNSHSNHNKKLKSGFFFSILFKLILSTK